MSETLSVCVIFRDEEKYLSDCLQSIIELCHECILVDSGSRDRSLEIAREFETKYPGKAKTFVRQWPDDFSDQKNYAIQQATSDWILFLDADERLDVGDHAKLRSALAQPEISAYELPIMNYSLDPTEIDYQPPQKNGFLAYGYVITRLHRLFRRNPDIFYVGRFHERIEPQLLLKKLKTTTLDVPIHHIGRIKEREDGLERKRYEFYENLARKKIEDDPSNAQAYWELGVVVQKQRRYSEAEQLFSKAKDLEPSVDEYEVYWALSLFQQSRWEALLKAPLKSLRAQTFQKLAKAQSEDGDLASLETQRSWLPQVDLWLFELALRKGQVEKREDYRAKALETFSSTGFIEFIEGAYHRQQGNLDAALPLLRRAYASGCRQALHDLLLALTQQQLFNEALGLVDRMSAWEKKALAKDTQTVIRYAQEKLKER